MEYSILFDLIDAKLLHEWREEAKQDGKCGFRKKENEIKEQLITELNDKGKELLDDYSRALKNRLDFIYYNVNIKLLNFGIKIGMELQKSFLKFEED